MRLRITSLRFAAVLWDIHIERITAQIDRHGISGTDVQVKAAGLINLGTREACIVVTAGR